MSQEREKKRMRRKWRGGFAGRTREGEIRVFRLGKDKIENLKSVLIILCVYLFKGEIPRKRGCT